MGAVRARVTRIEGTCPMRTYPQPRAFTLIIPRGDNRRRKIKGEELQGVADELSEHFGGVTVDKEVQGCWWNDEAKKKQCERNVRMTVVRNYTEGDGLTRMEDDVARDTCFRDVAKINDVAERIGVRFGQGQIFADVTDLEAAYIPGHYNENIDRSLVDWSFWFLNKLPNKLKF